MCVIKLEYHPKILKAIEDLEDSMIEPMAKFTGKSIEEITETVQRTRKIKHKRIANDRPFIFGGAGTFECANRHINYEINDDAVLEWLKEDIAKLVKINYCPVTHTKYTGCKLILEELTEMEPLDCIKVPKQSKEYKYAKRVNTNELHCLEGSIRLMLRDVPKMTRAQITLLQFVYMAVYHVLVKKVKTEKEQYLYDRINMLFETYKELAGYTKVTTATPMWTRAIWYFVARALFDPECIRVFLKMETSHKNPKLANGLTVLLDAVTSVVSTKSNKQEVYTCVLDTVMRVIELEEND